MSDLVLIILKSFCQLGKQLSDIRLQPTHAISFSLRVFPPSHPSYLPSLCPALSETPSLSPSHSHSGRPSRRPLPALLSSQSAVLLKKIWLSLTSVLQASGEAALPTLSGSDPRCLTKQKLRGDTHRHQGGKACRPSVVPTSCTDLNTSAFISFLMEKMPCERNRNWILDFTNPFPALSF